MQHLTRQVIAFSAGIAAVGALAFGGIALAQGDPEPARTPDGPVAEHPLADATYLIECIEDNLLSAPDTFTIACADGNANLAQLAWEDWGADEATAVGDLVVNTCEPTCADGTLETYPVRVTAGDLVHGEAVQAYGSLTLHFTGEVPDGFDQDEVVPQIGVEPIVPDLDQ